MSASPPSHPVTVTTVDEGPELPPTATPALGTVQLDAGLRILEVNDAFCGHLGLTSGELKGEYLPRYLRPSADVSLREHFDELLRGRRSEFSVPMTLVDAHGAETDCLVTGIALTSAPHTGCTLIALVVPDGAPGTPLLLAPGPTPLTAVPARILEGVAAGLSTQQLASRLGLSSHGVEYHISVMMRKLKAPNRSALVARAYALNLFVHHCWPPQVRPRCVTRFPVGASTAGPGAPASPGLVPAQHRTKNPA